MARSSRSTRGLEPAFYGDLKAALLDFWGETGVEPRVTSKRRSRAEQARLRRRYLGGKGGRAAKAGQSAHEYGLAADVLLDVRDNAKPGSRTVALYQKLHRIAGRYGIEGLSGTDDLGHLQRKNWQRFVRR